jgi:hypothetical protein
MKNNNKKFTNMIRSLEDAFEFDTEDIVEKYEKFNNGKQIKRPDFDEFESTKKPSKPREASSNDTQREW